MGQPIFLSVLELIWFCRIGQGVSLSENLWPKKRSFSSLSVAVEPAKTPSKKTIRAAENRIRSLIPGLSRQAQQLVLW